MALLFQKKSGNAILFHFIMDESFAFKVPKYK